LENRPAKSRVRIQIRRDEFDSAIKFANSNPHEMSVEELVQLIYTYCCFVFEEGSSLIHFKFSDMNLTLSKGLKPGCSTKTVAERQAFFTDLRDHLRSRFDGIIGSVESTEDELLFEIVGRISIRASEHRFVKKFITDDRPFPMDETLDLVLEKRKVDTKLFYIIDDLELDPARLKNCPKCGTYFYQQTRREKTYCSQRCAGAVRQRMYEQRKSNQ
jgi:hypothetical protein